MKAKAVLALLCGWFVQTAVAEQATLLNSSQLGKVVQIAAEADSGLWAVNQQGELWQFQHQKWAKQAVGFSPKVAISAGFGRVSGADKQGYFLNWQSGQLQHSTVPLAENAGMVQLGLATIAVSQQHGRAYLVRIEDGQVVARRDDVALLPDSRPLRVNLSGADNSQGHIAVLAEPTDEYAHGILGDSLEAKAIYYVERHHLQDLATPLQLPTGEVFEANQLQTLENKEKNEIVTVVAGQGAYVATIGVEQGALQLKYRSEPIATLHRWLSPFVRAKVLYTVQKPHLAGELLQHSYPNAGKVALLGQGLSNHEIGQREMNLALTVGEQTWLPDLSHRQLFMVDHQGLKPTKIHFPAAVKMSRTDGKMGYFLLENGEVYGVR